LTDNKRIPSYLTVVDDCVIMVDESVLLSVGPDAGTATGCLAEVHKDRRSSHRVDPFQLSHRSHVDTLNFKGHIWL
jgi:hypothetical protein